MPATEKTWRDQKVLHVVFGCTGLVLLISTVWMFGADHSRQWKKYQRTNRRVATTTTEWRMAEQQSADILQKRKELESELAEELASPFAAELVDDFVETLIDVDAKYGDEVKSLHKEITDSTDTAEKTAKREKLSDLFEFVIRRAQFRESNESRKRKFKNADYDEVKANFDLGIRDELDESELEKLQAVVDSVQEDREGRTLTTQEATKYRETLVGFQREALAKQTDIEKKITDNRADYDRLVAAFEERHATYFTSTPPFLGKKFLELPIIDAFNSPLTMPNLWTKDLTISNGSFGQVTRFDRCTACHQNIDKTAPGSAVNPFFEHEHEVVLQIVAPDSRPEPEENEEGNVEQPTLAKTYGFALAEAGLIDAEDVTVNQIIPGSMSATANIIRSEWDVEKETSGFQVGDIIRFIGKDKVNSNQDVEQILLRDANWGETIEVRVERGLPHPYASHPRLDLFVGSLSPHQVSKFGCSICHEGQGSATDFKWVSHTPNSTSEADEWSLKYGWFNNHHWIYPMYPKRFAESSCLKCHHDVVELDSSEKFAEAPAPKLIHGYNLIRKYGCFGCHEISGYAGPDTRIGPDMRLEPNYFAAAAQIKSDQHFDQLPDEQQDWVRQLVQHPERDAVRHSLLDFLKNDAAQEEPVLSEVSNTTMAAVLEDIEIPGKLRKVGPSLRYVGSKVGKSFLYDWIRDPTAFRPSTKMPKFFGHWNHLKDDPVALDKAKRFEPIEILGMVEFLVDRSQEMEFLDPYEGITDTTQQDAVERGKVAFEIRGCLACHSHDAFPKGHANQGPNLTNIGDKFALDDTPDANKWLHTWLRQPKLYHARTTMPNLYLEPIENEDGTTTDPAADIATFLLSSSNGWKPNTTNRLEPNAADLDALVLEHLKAKIFSADAEDALKNGVIPEEVAKRLKGSERELVGGPLDQKRKLHYIGSKTISKYGCYACHDIPGFEDAKPIGTQLAEWGRKDPSKLAFEHINEYLHHGHGAHGHAAGSDHGEGHDESSDAHDDHSGDSHESDSHSDVASHDDDSDFDEEFYLSRVGEHDRVGFIWQKLKEPRSYDYMKSGNKDSYNDNLRMPQFSFTNEEREAVITFVIGLVSEPPSHDFVYHPDEKQAAMIAGKKAIEKFNCGGCHILEPQKWTLAMESGFLEFPEIDEAKTFPFMIPTASKDDIEASKVEDAYKKLITAHVYGMPQVNSQTAEFEIFNEDYESLTVEDLEDPEFDPSTLLYQFDIWKQSVVDGQVASVGMKFEIPNSIVLDKQPAVGGDLTFQLMPRVLELEQQANPNADGKQAWSWLPPPLIGEGSKVQSAWLHQFLLEPYPIRPAVFMRMPQFNMSPQEATDIVNYFAARDGANYPYDYNPRRETTRLEALANAYDESLESADVKPEGEGRFNHAMNIVMDTKTYCAQCHSVGDFAPNQPTRGRGPNLAQVETRLRPEYLRRWLANPRLVLPYTPMPENFKYDVNAAHQGGIEQTFFHGTSEQQLDAIVDLLMNYGKFTSERANVSEYLKAPNTEAQPEAESDAAQ